MNFHRSTISRKTMSEVFSDEHSEASGMERQNILLTKLYSKSIGWAFTKVRAHHIVFKHYLHLESSAEGMKRDFVVYFIASAKYETEFLLLRQPSLWWSAYITQFETESGNTCPDKCRFIILFFLYLWQLYFTEKTQTFVRLPKFEFWFEVYIP